MKDSAVPVYAFKETNEKGAKSENKSTRIIRFGLG